MCGRREKKRGQRNMNLRLEMMYVAGVAESFLRTHFLLEQATIGDATDAADAHHGNRHDQLRARRKQHGKS